jgi:hypothetical protein
MVKVDKSAGFMSATSARIPRAAASSASPSRRPAGTWTRTCPERCARGCSGARFAPWCARPRARYAAGSPRSGRRRGAAAGAAGGVFMPASTGTPIANMHFARSRCEIEECAPVAAAALDGHAVFVEDRGCGGRDIDMFCFRWHGMQSDHVIWRRLVFMRHVDRSVCAVMMRVSSEYALTEPAIILKRCTSAIVSVQRPRQLRSCQS